MRARASGPRKAATYASWVSHVARSPSALAFPAAPREEDSASAAARIAERADSATEGGKPAAPRAAPPFTRRWIRLWEEAAAGEAKAAEARRTAAVTVAQRAAAARAWRQARRWR